MSAWSALQISGSALAAERLRLDIITENLANLHTTRTATGEPYRRKVAVLAEQPATFAGALAEAGLTAAVSPVAGGKPILPGGVQVAEITEDPSPFRRKYDPGHPDAGPDGWVELPNVDVALEMMDLVAASRSYEANVTALNAAKAMALRALEIGR